MAFNVSDHAGYEPGEDCMMCMQVVSTPVEIFQTPTNQGWDEPECEGRLRVTLASKSWR